MVKRIAALCLFASSSIALVSAAQAQLSRRQPWLDRSLSAERRAAAAVEHMTTDEKLKLVVGYFATDQDGKHYKAPPQSRYGSAGYVPGIARMGIPPQWQTDAGVGVATQGGSATKRERTSFHPGWQQRRPGIPTLHSRAGK